MSDPGDLALARGKVREGVACIENLAQLLASRRIGPRQLPHALPEVLAECPTLVAALAALEAEIAAELSDDPEGRAALKAMLAHASGRVRELGAALEGRAPGPMDAKERLRLEAIVGRVASELDTVLRITDLIGAAATIKTTAIDLRDVLAQRRPKGRSLLTPVLAVVELRTPALVADARIMLELLEFAVATVVRAGVDSPRIVADRGPEASLLITVAEPTAELVVEAGQAEIKAPQVIDVSCRAELPEEATVVRAAARKAGISLEISEGGRCVRIVV